MISDQPTQNQDNPQSGVTSVLPSQAQDPSGPGNRQLFNDLCQQIEQAMQRFPVPGVAVGVIDGDREYTAGFGVTSIDNPLPVTDETLFQIGSTTKTVTGTLAMRLVEEGKLDLDVPVRTYLPELRLMEEDVAA